MLITRICTAAIALALCAAPSAAGDFSERHIFGFSPDGGHFAFEEYGVQDGSGFPYSNIYMIDVTDDSWLPGTPLRVRIDDESATLEEARLQSHQQAAGRLEKFRIGRQPVHVASNPYTQLNADFNFVLVNPRLVAPPIDRPYAFRLSAYPLPGAADYCADFGETKGFQLELIYGADDTSVILQRDERLPQSRACPLDYQIADIYTFYPESGAPVFAALIRMIGVGFEGPDGRYLAVTGQLPN